MGHHLLETGPMFGVKHWSKTSCMVGDFLAWLWAPLALPMPSQVGAVSYGYVQVNFL